MSKNFIWGIFVFSLNLFMLYQNYTKNFTITSSFFIEANEMIAFIVGILYANQYRKFDFKHITGLVINSIAFSTLTTLLFGLYGCGTNILFLALVAIFSFTCSFVGYALFYFFFCPKRHKRQRILPESVAFFKKKHS